MIKNITYGSDPEFFIVDMAGKAVSSIGIIPGNKENPKNLSSGYSILKDNVLLEMNIPMSENKDEFVNNMKKAKEMAMDILTDYNCTIHEEDVMEFEYDQLQHPEAREFGCSPYENAWEGFTVTAPSLENANFRVAGFHLHIGYDTEYDMPKEIINTFIAKALDVFLLVPARNIHSDPRREFNYGAPGSFRHKPYGLEYRALGGFFTKDEYLPWVFDRVQEALKFCSSEENLYKLADLYKEYLDDLEAIEHVLGINIYLTSKA